MSEPTRGSSFYDRSLLDAYLPHRHKSISSPNLVMEQPAFLAELGDIAGLRILDLGCGDGRFAEHCRAAGAVSYLGVDGSEAMITEARDMASGSGLLDVSGFAAGFQLADLEDFQPPPESFDVVVSRMALHYVADLGAVLSAVRKALTAGGRLVLSVVHPVLSSTDRGTKGPRTDQAVDDYFTAGPRTRQWFDRPVVWHHRTIEQHVSLLTAHGFAIVGLREGTPVETLFEGDRDEYERRLRVPVFLVLQASVRGTENS